MEGCSTGGRGTWLDANRGVGGLGCRDLLHVPNSNSGGGICYLNSCNSSSFRTGKRIVLGISESIRSLSDCRGEGSGVDWI